MMFLRKILGNFRLPKTKCVICIKAKQARKPFVSSERVSNAVLELIHMDVCGPMPRLSIGGHKYLYTIIDDYSRKLFVYPLKSKTEVFDNFLSFVNMAEKQTEKKLKAIRSDNGTEFINYKFKDFCTLKGVVHQKTVPYTPQQNGVAERYNRTIMERVRGMLLDSGLGEQFWKEAAETAAYLINIVPKQRSKLSANEKWNNEVTDLGKLRIFGEKVMVHIPKEKRSKLTQKSKECIWLGYTLNGDKVYDPVGKRIELSRDIITIADATQFHVKPETQNSSKPDVMSAFRGTHVDSEEGQIDMNPQNVNEVMISPEAEKWKAAMESEYQSLMENQTWILTDLPEGKRPIKSKWVFTTKRDQEGNILRYKARLVARGFSQVEGIDYNETFAPVVRYTSIRILLSIASHMKLRISQMDAVTAYLNGTLEEELYMEQPEGFEAVKGKYCRLVKSLYGLKQAGRVWNETLDKVLRNYGLEKSKMDQCIYYSVKDGEMLILAIYVDDILIFSSNHELEKNLKDELQRNFKMKDMGAASSILGIRITRNEKFQQISIDQEAYIREILKRFKMTDCNAVSTPLDPNQRITASMEPQNQAENMEMAGVPYRQAIGSLLFLSIITRPDIGFAVNLLSRYCENPGKAHWGAVKRIFRYLRGTMKYKLTYGGTENELTGYCDADWASDMDQRKSTTGYVYTMFGGAVSWNSKRQPTIALSSTEAEYMSMVSAIQECKWLKQFLEEIFGINEPVTIYCDNKGALQVFLNNSYSPRTKHMDIKDKFIREKINDGEVNVKYIETNEMPADILTKAVPGSKILKHLPVFGVNNRFV